MSALAKRIKERNDRKKDVVEWSLCPTPANDNNVPRNAIEELEARINAQHAENLKADARAKYPTGGRAFANNFGASIRCLETLEEKRAELLAPYFDGQVPKLSEDDAAIIEEALRVRQKYENTAPDNTTTADQASTVPSTTAR